MLEEVLDMERRDNNDDDNDDDDDDDDHECAYVCCLPCTRER